VVTAIRIISRYLLKEVFASLLAVTLVLLLIFLSNQLVRYLSYAASGKIAAQLVLQLMGYEIPYLLALLLPLGLYLGIILAYGRLYADSEMSVLNACGMGLRSLIEITSLLAIVIAAIVLMLVFWINPVIAQEKALGIAQNNILDTLRPGRFQVLSGGRRVVYVERISRNRKRADNLFIAEEQKDPPNDESAFWVIVSAKEGFQAKDPVTKENFIVSTEGYRYEGTPGQNEYKVIQFRKYSIRAPSPINSIRLEQEAVPTLKLWRDYNNPLSAAELQWRVSMPLTVLILMLMAIPFCRIRPRQGRYINLLPAMLIYIIYVNLLFVSRNWVEIKMVPVYVGMWWVHLLALAVALSLLFFQQRYQLRPFRLFKRGTSVS
jgi:lipopolysaccharide export system permease protein